MREDTMLIPESHACRNLKRIWGIICVFCWLCGSSVATAGQHVTYRLKWLRNMSTAGDLLAAQQGYFKDEDLEVSIRPGGPERDPIRELELGYADFGVASADQVIRAVAKGSPVMVVAQLFQVNPLQWIYRRQRFTIKKPQDLRGKTIGVTFGKNDEMIMRALLDQARISASQVHLYGVRLDYTPFYKGLVDLWPVYINTQGVEIGTKLKNAGEPVGFLNPAEFGIRFVANSLVTTQTTLNKHPDVARRFVRAVLKGWRQFMNPDNDDRVIAAVRRFDEDTRLDVMRRQLAATRRLVQPKPDSVVGSIDRQAWRQTELIMLHHHQIAAPVHVEDRLKPLISEKR
jgi:NitT/TauT family transport system substrate-binding protein